MPKTSPEDEAPKVPKVVKSSPPEAEYIAKLTPNGRQIFELLRLTKKKGNPKDFVIIVGKRMLDYWGSYDMENKEGKSVGVEGVALIHKRELHKVVGDELASKFWNRKTGMRVPGKTLAQMAKEAKAKRKGDR